MNKNFLCPRCKGYLNVGQNIILAANGSLGDSGLVIFNSEIGNYSTETHPNFNVKEGEKYEFFCPICQKKFGRKNKRTKGR